MRNCNGCKSKKCICPPGPTGATGPQGVQGNTGADGATGASAPNLSARVFNGVNQTVLSAVTTVLAFNSERFDDGGFHDNAVFNSRLTVPASGPVSGKYQITGQARLSTPGSASGLRQLFIRLNGGPLAIAVSTVSPGALETVDMIITTLYDLEAGDYVELIAVQTSGVGGIVEFADDFSPDFMIVLVG